MLRFNIELNNSVNSNLLFQYILCYGSTCSKSLSVGMRNKISIHPMLRFNLSLTLTLHYVQWFQYILCYGSTSNKIFHFLFTKNFNTSYVTVQPLVLCDLYFLSYRKTIDTTSVYKNFSNDRHFFQKRTKNRLWYMCIRASFFLSIFYHWKI